MLNHNSKIRDFFIILDHKIFFWDFPLFILTSVFQVKEKPASKIVKKYRKYWRSWSIRPLAGITWYKNRTCKRQLKYLGCHWCPEEDNEDAFFKVGQVYTSKTFNGVIYTIEGYNRQIGSEWFERVK